MNLEQIGRRYYFRNAPFMAKDALKEGGCKWDPQEKAWWVGTKSKAEALLAKLKASPNGTDNAEGISTSAEVIRGRARYNGKEYYLLADGVSRTSGKPYAKLAFRDGSKVFWAQDPTRVEVLRRYEEPKSIDGLRRYAERMKRTGGLGRLCQCAFPLDEGDGECMRCGYYIR